MYHTVGICLCTAATILGALFVLVWRRKSRKRRDALRIPTDQVPSSDVIVFEAILNGVEGKILMGREGLFWSSMNEWRSLDYSELAGCKRCDNSSHIVEVYGWYCHKQKTQKRKKNSVSSASASSFQHLTGWIIQMISVLIWQIARLIGSLVGENNAQNRLTAAPNLRFVFSKKIEATRFYHILLTCCTLEREVCMERALQSSTFIPILPKKRNALVIVNPRSGNREAISIMEQLKPFMAACRELIHFSIVETQHAFHAKEMGQDFDASEFDTIICVGGDGIPYEVVNGIMDRDDGQKVIQTISLGIIPAGTGNGITASLGIKSPQHAIMRIIQGKIRKFDVMHINQDNNPNLCVYSLLQVSYGMMSDIDFESECIRFVGDLRFTLMAVFRLIFLRQYPITYSLEAETEKMVLPNKSVVWEKRVGEDRSVNLELNTVWCGGLNTSWLASDFNCAPDAEVDDGLIHFLQLPFPGYLTLFTFFFEMNSGKHMRYPFKFYTTKEFTLNPKGYPGVPCRLDVDGECISIKENELVHVKNIAGFCRFIV